MVLLNANQTKTKKMKSEIKGEVSIEMDVPATKVWEALVTPSLIKQYFFGTEASSDWKPGSPITFKGVWEGRSYLDKGTILRVEPGKLLRYNYWSSISGIEDKPENYAIITYELTERNGTTLMKVTQENIPDEKMKKHSEENWGKVLKSLKEMLQNAVGR